MRSKLTVRFINSSRELSELSSREVPTTYVAKAYV